MPMAKNVSPFAFSFVRNHVEAEENYKLHSSGLLNKEIPWEFTMDGEMSGSNSIGSIYLYSCLDLIADTSWVDINLGKTNTRGVRSSFGLRTCQRLYR